MRLDVLTSSKVNSRVYPSKLPEVEYLVTSKFQVFNHLNLSNRNDVPD